MVCLESAMVGPYLAKYLNGRFDDIYSRKKYRQVVTPVFTLAMTDVENLLGYDCRSTFCSRMYAAGIQPVLIELLMGHAGNGLIHTYAKADDDFKRDAAAKLEAFIASKSSAEITSTTSTTWVN